jgi:hypothetical protein
MPRTVALVLVLSASSIASSQSEIPDIDDSSWRRPLGNRNQVPLALLFVSLTPDRATALEKGRLELDAVFDYSNIIFHREVENELLHLDMEYLRTLVTARRGFGWGLELGVELPVYAYFGGIFDTFVSSFHETFGFPNHLRGSTPPGLAEFEYRRGGEVVLAGAGFFGGVGDLAIHARKELYRGDSHAFSVRTALKLPTGDPQKLSGSGAADLGVGLAFQRVRPRYGLYLNGGYHFLGDGEPFETRDYVAVSAAVDWRFKPRVAAVLQTDFMSPPVRMEILKVNPGLNLGLGLRYRHSDAFTYEWRFVEDLSKFATDFTFAFQVEMRTKGPEGKGR